MDVNVHIGKQEADQQGSQSCQAAQQQRVSQRVVERIVAEDPRERVQCPVVLMQLDAQVAHLDPVHLLDNPAIFLERLGRRLHLRQLVQSDKYCLILVVYGFEVKRIALLNVVHRRPARKQAGGIVQRYNPVFHTFCRRRQFHADRRTVVADLFTFFRNINNFFTVDQRLNGIQLCLANHHAVCQQHGKRIENKKSQKNNKRNDCNHQNRIAEEFLPVQARALTSGHRHSSPSWFDCFLKRGRANASSPRSVFRNGITQS